MKQEKTNEKLFTDFPAISTEKWMDKITADLKGADFERKLVWNSPEGISVRPFYRAEDLKEVSYLDSMPNEFPYVRGTKTDNNDWYVRQDIVVDNVKAANVKALEVLEKGVTSLGFVFSDRYDFQMEDMATLLKDIVLDAVEINFVNTAANSHKMLVAFEDYIKQQGVNAAEVYGSFDYDPFSLLLLKGHYCKDEQRDFEVAAQLVEAVQSLPHVQVLSANGLNLRNAAANTVEELAFVLAAGAEYITRLTEMGYEAAQIAPHIRFNLGVGANYFMEIAKLRAARSLWAQVVKAYGATDEASKMHIHSANSVFNKCVYDAHANMLRTTTETLSAIVGGTDSFTVLPYNACYEKADAFSERIARNQQLLLKEEAFLDKIADPAAGSYYVEHLTSELMQKSWALFLQVDEHGSYSQAIAKGFVQAIVEKAAEERRHAAATRRDIYLGTNQYPNFTEAMDKELSPEALKPFDQRSNNASFATIKQFRAAQAFENLRYATDNYSKNNKRPLAFMLTIGNLAMRKARAQFACNFFACAGFDVKDNNGFASVEDGLTAAREAQADIVVLCSSDDEYAEHGPVLAEKAADTIAVVAGYPKAIMDDLKAKGLRFVHVKSNLLQELSDYQQALHIV